MSRLRLAISGSTTMEVNTLNSGTVSKTFDLCKIILKSLDKNDYEEVSL